MKILVNGGSGVISTAVTHQLVDLGATVYDRIVDAWKRQTAMW